jgi:hypothetical protein
MRAGESIYSIIIFNAHVLSYHYVYFYVIDYHSSSKYFFYATLIYQDVVHEIAYKCTQYAVLNDVNSQRKLHFISTYNDHDIYK